MPTCVGAEYVWRSSATGRVATVRSVNRNPASASVGPVVVAVRVELGWLTDFAGS